MPQANGIDALTRRRQERTTREQQKLEPKRKNPGARGELTELPVAAIAHNPRNRRDSSEYADTKAQGLAQSMQWVGVLQPLGVVRKDVWLRTYNEWVQANPERVDTTEFAQADWIVEWGNRRLAAARIAKIDRVPIRVYDQLEEQGRGHTASVVSNIHDSPLAPLAEAADVDELVGEYGSRAAVADILGKSPGWVTQRLNLLNLVPQLQAALQDGSLKLEHARSLGAIVPSRQMAAWQAGPPYRDPAKQPRKAAPDVVPGDSATYSRSELPTDESASKMTRSTAAESERRPGASSAAGSDDLEPSARTQPPELSFSAATAPSPIPTEPPELARLITAHLSAEAVAELVDLLRT